MKRRLSLALTALCVASATLAAPPYQRPAGFAELTEPLITAGYRALFTCSAHFVAGRPLEDIEKVELADAEVANQPDPVIDEQRRIVVAPDRSGRVAGIAAYRDSMGCTVLPPQWDERDIGRLPYVALPPTPDLSKIAFPAGDLVDVPAAGIDPAHAALAPIVERAFDPKAYGADGLVTTAVIVAHKGRIVAERYRPGFGVHSGYRTWSTAKSMTAVMLGIAAAKGILDINGRADIPEWAYVGDPRQAITYKQLLWMSSGLFSGGPNTYAVYFGGQDVISAVTTTQLEAEPGTRWKYANNDTLLLGRALRFRLADDTHYLRFPYDELFHPLGMHHTRMEVDHQGNFVGSSQVYTTARDLTRFGLLLADDGVWNGRRMLPAGFVKFVATPAPTKPPVKGEWGYGAQFWLFDQMPGIPPGTFSTAGNKGQYVTVVPGHDLVIVRTGVDLFGKRFAQDRLVAEVVAALQ